MAFIQAKLSASQLRAQSSIDGFAPARTEALFKVYLRLRPPSKQSGADPCFLSTIPSQPTSLYVTPPADPTGRNRFRAIEQFSFTEILDENTTQRDVFDKMVLPLLREAALGKDGLLATLGVTGSGKTHTILGGNGQRGVTQMALDVLFSGLGGRLVDYNRIDMTTADPSDALVMSAPTFFTQASIAMDSHLKRQSLKPSQLPDVSDITIPCEKRTRYAIIISMYEVYNDRIFDLLDETCFSNPSAKHKSLIYRTLSAHSEKKVVAGLRKIYVRTYEEALRLLDHGLACRHSSATGSNETSSRSHAFFAIEVKRWAGKTGQLLPSGTFTVVDLAGSERVRQAKTHGERLVEAGSINRSLMSLGQCLQLQTQSENGKPPVVPYRQSKLTELLFSNCFQPSSSTSTPQKAIMLVTADPRGDFNSTTQILRYSALARDVPVPRARKSSNLSASARDSDGRNSNVSTAAAIATAVEEATTEAEATIAKLRSQLLATTKALKAAERRAHEAERGALAMEQRVREEIAAEFDERAREMRYAYLGRLHEDEEHKRDFIDSKVEIALRSVNSQVWEEESILKKGGAVEVHELDWERYDELEDENEALKLEVEKLKRELAESKASSTTGGTPVRLGRTRKAILTGKKHVSLGMGLDHLGNVENILPEDRAV